MFRKLTFAVLFVLFGIPVPCHADTPKTVTASNLTYPTIYEEEDNVHAALRPPTGMQVKSFDIEARQPTYVIGQDHTGTGNFPPGTDPVYPYADPGVFKIYDDGTTVIDAVRESTSWRPTAMTVNYGSTTIPNIHFLQVYRRIPGVDSWPQIAVLYTDSYIRLKPFPELGRTDQAFGSSVIVGPSDDLHRPYADISSMTYLPGLDAFKLTYRAGGSSEIAFEAVNRDVTRVGVTVDYGSTAFARLRSMYVAMGDADVDHVHWLDSAGVAHSDPILNFAGGTGSQFLFTRDVRSLHNTSAPDIWFGNFAVVPEPLSLLCALPLLALALLRRGRT